MPTSTADFWDTIAADAGQESALWNAALRPREEQERDPAFSPLGEPRYALGIETIYEGYLLHYGRPRLFSPEDQDAALLLGDYLYAHGLVRIAEFMQKPSRPLDVREEESHRPGGKLGHTEMMRRLEPKV